MKYPFQKWTRVAFPPTVADLSAPTVDELTAVVDDYYLDVYTEEYIGTLAWAYDIQCELTPDGLNISTSTDAINATPWKGNLKQVRPIRYGVDIELTAFRRTPPDVEVLWNGAQWKQQRVLVVRRGVPVGQDWAAGDAVECYRVTIGRRAMTPSGAAKATTFTVPLFVSALNDDAVLVS